MVVTGTYHFNLYEVEIPELVKVTPDDYSAIKKAKVVTDWGEFYGDSVRSKAILPYGDYWYDNETSLLYWTYYNSYYCGNTKDAPFVHTTRLNSDGTKENIGSWYFPDTLKIFKGYWGGIKKLSQNFAQKYTGGREFALGFGGYYSICGTASRGPALAAIGQPNLKDTVVDMVEIMCYHNPKSCPRDGNYFNNVGYWQDNPSSPWQGWWTSGDHCGTGVFIDLPDKKGYMVLCSQGNGRLAYDSGGGCYHCQYGHSWYFYDLKDLGKAINGEIGISDIMPSSYNTVQYPLNGGVVSGSCFDDESRILYIYSRESVGNKPAIHAYHLKEENTNPTKVSTPDKNKLTVYPNPSDGLIFINMQDFDSAEIISPNGELFVRSTSKNIDIRNLPKGVYFVKVTNATGTAFIEKIIHK